MSSSKHQTEAIIKASCQRISAVICLSLLISSCKSNKFVQCEQIFSISRDVNQSNQNFDNIGNDEPGSMKSWLQAANKFNRAADKMRVLKVDRLELAQYQDRLARIYRLYAQTTYDAVRARENQDLSELQSARNEANQAGIVQRQLIQEINAYCLEAE